MKIINTTALILFLFLNYSKGKTQIISGNAFLQGNYVEVGIAPCGSFGTTVSAPLGYHANAAGGTLGFIADSDKDGWAVGSPVFCGDYFLPGTAEEGWGIEFGGAAFNNNLQCSVNGIPGGITSYTNVAGKITAIWDGLIGGLEIKKQTVLFDTSLYFTTTVTITNTNATPVNNVFYMRNVDPDNENLLTGDFNTTNTIESQASATNDTAFVSAVGSSFACYLGLASLDNRARVTHGGFSNRDPSDVWNGIGLSQIGSVTADEAVSISFNLATMDPGECVSFSYAYILGPEHISEALISTIPYGFQANSLNVVGNVLPSCPGDPINLDITNAPGYTWTWSPATFLNTTVGPSVIATPTADIWYYISGTPPAGSLACPVFDSIFVPFGPDTIAPEFSSCSADINITTTIACIGEVFNYSAPVASDFCSSVTTTQISGPPSGSVFPIGTTNISYSAVDASGNTSFCSYNVIITSSIDITPPTPNTATLVDSTAICSLAAMAAPTATDNCTGTITGTTTTVFPIVTQGTTIVTWTFDDGNGNSSTQTQNVVITDAIPPVPNSATLIDSTAICSLAAMAAPTATDNCTGTIIGTTTTVFPIVTQGTTIVTWTFDDGNGNSSTQTQNVVITDPIPPVPNVVTLADSTAECSIITMAAPTATDNCTGTITGTTTTVFPIVTQGTTIVTWTYNDGNGNSSTQTQNVVITDVTPPIPNGATLDSTANCSIATMVAPTATDNCTGTITGTTTTVFPIVTQGITIVTWTYNDGNGNSSTQTQNVVINDVTPPTPNTATLIDSTAECSLATMAAPTATDNCTGPITGTTSAVFPIVTQGTTIVTWTFIDVYGNSSTQTQNVVINDVTPPIPDDTLLVDSTAICLVASMAAPTATDNCTGTITGTTTTIFPIVTKGTTIVTWIFDDGNGNSSTQTQNVVITDAIPPVPDDTLLVDSTAICILDSMVAPTATDNCTGSITGTTTTVFPITTLGTTIVTWTFDDGNGNSSTQTQNVVLNFDTSVVISGDTITANFSGATYQWLDCDNNYDSIIGETSQSLIKPNDGNYAVLITMGNCTDTSACVNINTVSINEINFGAAIKLHPNPTTGNVNINFGQSLTNGSVIISDITGKQVYNLEGLNNQTLNLNINHFSKGIYFVKIQNNNEQKVIKLIKQ